jgi:hypothetical protein
MSDDEQSEQDNDQQFANIIQASLGTMRRPLERLIMDWIIVFTFVIVCFLAVGLAAGICVWVWSLALASF